MLSSGAELYEPKIILGIETSCDETAAAVVLNGRTILGSVVASQVEIHSEYGGIVPEIASRKHTRDRGFGAVGFGHHIATHMGFKRVFAQFIGRCVSDGDKDTREQQQKALEFFGVYESVGKDTDEERRDDGGDGGAGVGVADGISHTGFKHEAPQTGKPRPPDKKEDEHHRAEV